MKGSRPIDGRAQRRQDAAFAVFILGGIAAFALVVLWIQGLAEDLRTANRARDALARQVQQLGATPVAGKPGSRGEVGATGPPGPRGPAGPPGPRSTVAGPAGKPAPTITPKPGRDGKDGAPGADSTAPGPQGLRGEPGADSTVPGPQGPQGERGEQGPAPSGWTFTDPQGVTYECAPDGGAHYTCRPTSEPEPNPGSARGGPQAMPGLDPQRRQWA